MLSVFFILNIIFSEIYMDKKKLIKSKLKELIIRLILYSIIIIFFDLLLNKFTKENEFFNFIYLGLGIIVLPSLLAISLNTSYTEIINKSFGKRLANILKKYDELNFTTGLYLLCMFFWDIIILILIILTRGKFLEKYELMVICILYVAVSAPFWAGYYLFCSKKIKTIQISCFALFLKTIRSIMVSIAAVFLIVANIYSLGNYDAFKLALYAVAYITGCIGSVAYPLFDMYGYTHKTIDSKL